MANLQSRIERLEAATPKNDFRPRPLSYFYGEPLPDDFYTNPKYIKPRGRPLKAFYSLPG